VASTKTHHVASDPVCTFSWTMAHNTVTGMLDCQNDRDRLNPKYTASGLVGVTFSFTKFYFDWPSIKARTLR